MPAPHRQVKHVPGSLPTHTILSEVQGSADHLYLFDEAVGSTTFQDSGVVNLGGGNADLVTTPGTAPLPVWGSRIRGPAKGSPAVYGIHIGRETEGEQLAHLGGPTGNGPDGTTWTTGTLMCWVRLHDVLDADAGLRSTVEVLGVSWGANQTNGVFLEVLTDGSVRARVRNDALTKSLTTTTAAGVVTQAGWHLITAKQAADGNGIRVWVDDVDRTGTQTAVGTGVTLDSWVADIFDPPPVTPTEGGRIMVGNFVTKQTGGSGQPRAVALSVPAIWRSTAVANFRIQSTYQGRGTFITDYYEVLEDAAPVNSWVHHWPGRSIEAAASNHGHEFAAIRSNGFNVRLLMANFESANVELTSGVRPQGALYSGEYAVWSNVATAWSSIRRGLPPVSATGDYPFTAGCIIAWVRTDTWAGRDRRIVSVGVFGSRGLRITLLSTGVLRYEIGSGSVHFFRRDVTIPALVAGGWHMLAVVQSGTGVVVYWDGQAPSATDTIGGSGWSATSWLNDLDVLGGNDLAVGHEPGSPSSNNWEPNAMSQVLISTAIPTAGQISALWGYGSGLP